MQHRSKVFDWGILSGYALRLAGAGTLAAMAFLLGRQMAASFSSLALLDRLLAVGLPNLLGVGIFVAACWYLKVFDDAQLGQLTARASGASS